MNYKDTKEIFTCTIVFIGFLLASYGVSADDVVSEIRNSFDSYRQALTNNSGVQASSVISQKTLNYYQTLRDSALKDSKEEVRQLPILMKMTVLMYRIRLKPSELQSMNGKKLFIHSVNNGWISQNSVNNVELGQIEVKDDSASANVVSGGKQRNLQFDFHRENGEWKIDLTSMMDVMDKGLQALAKSRQMTEDEVAMFLVERATGKKVTQRTWDKP